MAKKIVKSDYSISGMSIPRMYKQFRLYWRMPYVAIAEGPGKDCLFKLFCMHTIGRLAVLTEIKYPRIYQFLVRINNSLTFRYNHYKKKIRNKRLNAQP